MKGGVRGVAMEYHHCAPSLTLALGLRNETLTSNLHRETFMNTKCMVRITAGARGPAPRGAAWLARDWRGWLATGRAPFAD